MFVDKSQLRQVFIQEVEILLELNEHVFAPSQNGSFYATVLQIDPGERVIDIGTGSGILAIYAAKRGARVWATDIVPEAVELASRNFALNQVEIHITEGSLFGDHKELFDVILANLPNELVAPAYSLQVGHQLAQSFDGGTNGNECLLDLLERAKGCMHSKSRLYLPVHTLTDYHQVLGIALHSYNVKLLALAQLPVKTFVIENLAYYLALNEQGVIRIFKRGDTWYTNGYVYQLSLKN